ncbi:hypothetical protein PHISCL_05978 [Aspergillus sclerotialis]|uniref:Uncharacterized protein n=1 Tax=Aspergillus sclerotialis TaxID=2070753 RepID=A0A3A2ZJV1_9EURO|nr:hypothetical protein PHISCL_05978 [Aspergillus sclerotialis]
MRHTRHFLLAILGVTANAFPGRRDAAAPSSPSISPSNTPPSSSSSSLFASSTSTTTSSLPPISTLCEADGKTKETWNEFNMGSWVGYLANKFSPYDTDFPTTLADHSDGVYDWDCEIDVRCSWKITGDGCNNGNPENPRNFFVLTAIQHFYDWIQSALDAIQNSKIDFAVQSMSLTTTFTDHDIETSAQDWLPLALSGFLGGLSGIAAVARSASSGLLALAGGAAGTEGGISAATASNSATIIQEELDKMSGMEDAVANTTEILRSAFRNFGKSMIDEVPDNSEYYAYGSDPNALPKLLANGDFAEKVTSDDQEALDEAIGKAIFGAAISYLWVQEGGYIVDVSRSVYKVDPCTYDTDFLRICEDGRSYIFLRNDHIDPRLKGTTELEKFNVNAKELAESSSYVQSKLGYNAAPGTEDYIATMLNGDAPNSVFANIPVCNLDDLYDDWLPEDELYPLLGWGLGEKVNDYDMTISLISRNACKKQSINGKEWPLGDPS